MPVLEPVYTITYEGVNVTADLEPDLISMSLTDVLEGESDTLSIELNNRDLKWLDSWLPEEGDVIAVSVGYKDAEVFGPVTFEVDTISYKSPPDTLSLKALGTPITKALRQRNAIAYENVTLRQIAQQIADRNELELVGGDTIPNITFERETQKDVPDLEYLRKLSNDYGCTFKVESLTRLVFFREVDLENGISITELSHDGVSTSSVKRKSAGTYKQCEVTYQNAKKGEFISITVDLDGNEVPKPKDGEEGLINKADVLRLRERVESLAIAKIRAVEALRRANKARVTIASRSLGDPTLAAGVCIDYTGFNRLSGKYLLTKVRHQISSSGYTTAVDGRLV